MIIYNEAHYLSLGHCTCQLTYGHRGSGVDRFHASDLRKKQIIWNVTAGLLLLLVSTILHKQRTFESWKAHGNKFRQNCSEKCPLSLPVDRWKYTSESSSIHTTIPTIATGLGIWWSQRTKMSSFHCPLNKGHVYCWSSPNNTCIANKLFGGIDIRKFK